MCSVQVQVQCVKMLKEARLRSKEDSEQEQMDGGFCDPTHEKKIYHGICRKPVLSCQLKMKSVSAKYLSLKPRDI